jgi:hypothetical protein
MTHTTTSRPVKRETPAFHRGRAIVVELREHTVAAWLKGTRCVYHVAYEQVFKKGAENEERRRREERQAKRKRGPR